MEPWPPVLVFLWRFLVIPFFVISAAGGFLAGLNSLTAPSRIHPELIVIALVVIVVNIIAYRFEAHTRRMNALEKRIDALLQEPPETRIP